MPDEEDIIFQEYKRRIEKYTREYQELGGDVKDIAGRDGLLLTEIKALIDKRKEELNLKNMSIKQYKEQKQREEQRIRQLQEKQLRDKDEEIQKLQVILDTKEKMLIIQEAERNAQPKTIQVEKEEPLDESPPQEIIILKDEFGKSCVTRKIGKYI